MNFQEAHEELLKGKKIRRKEWEPFMHLRLIDKEVKTYKGEYTNFYASADILIDNNWLVIDGDGSYITFIQALEELRSKKSLTNKAWEGKDCFIFLDKDQIAMCKEVEFDFMPTYKCFMSLDWEVIK
jgi:hypothetical protein